MKLRDKIITVVFMIIIVAAPLYTLCSNLIQNKNIVSNETLKETGFIKFQSFMGDFTDSLIFHDEFIEKNVELSYLISGGDYIESTKVLGGKNKWLFYKADTDGMSVLDYQGLHYLSDEESENCREILTYTRDYLAEKGIDLIVMSAPNKELVYKEYMTDTLKVINEKSRGDVFAEYMKENSDVTFIYPKTELVEAKSFADTYYRLDSHWNYIGANVALQEIIKAEYGECDNPLRSELYTLVSEYSEGDLASMAKATSVYGMMDHYEFNTEYVDNHMCNDKVVFFIGDSFTENLEVVASAYFKEAYRVHIDDFTLDMIDQYQPDLIVYEAGERLLENIVDKNLFSK